MTTVSGESNGVPFRARGVRVLEPGWTALYPRKEDDTKEDEQDLPEFRIGESGPHEPVGPSRARRRPRSPTPRGACSGRWRRPASSSTTRQLKEALKERGLGTPATRAAIIETLLERGYIVREKKALAATDLGRYLIALVRDRGLK